MKRFAALTLGLAVMVATSMAQAQTDTTTAAVPCGPMWKLTPEQQAARVQFMQTTLEQLRAKKAAATITESEAAWLARVEQAGGWCVNGAPRGGCGFGPGNGPCNSTGPRAQMGLCPLAGNGAAAVAPGAQGQAVGKGRAGLGGRGRGAGQGLRDGTGPRGVNGTCPLATPAPAN